MIIYDTPTLLIEDLSSSLKFTFNGSPFGTRFGISSGEFILDKSLIRSMSENQFLITVLRSARDNNLHPDAILDLSVQLANLYRTVQYEHLLPIPKFTDNIISDIPPQPPNIKVPETDYFPSHQN